ncbi:MAG: energy transducer TonB [Acidobacteriota bacterium]
MPSVVTTEFVRDLDADPPFSLIEQESLGSRLIREIQAAVGELTRDPGGFIRELFSADTKDAKRRQRIYVGLTCAVVVHVALVVLIAVLGWRTMFVKHVDEAGDGIHVYFPIGPPKAERTQGPGPRGAKDDGGGGDHNPLPPTIGPRPTTSMDPQIIKPNTASVKLPSIPVTPTIVGPDGSPPPPGIALGVPTGVIAAAPSPGPGEGGGLGGNRGPGAGSGSGPGSGKGNRGGAGDKNRIGSPNGADDPKGPFSYNLFDRIPDRTPIVWLHRPTPIITPEAQANKVKGEVWLRATFGEDGKISDIEVIRDVPFMTESAVEALQRSRFRPATIKGRPVTLINVPVRINVDIVQR